MPYRLKDFYEASVIVHFFPSTSFPKCMQTFTASESYTLSRIEINVAGRITAPGVGYGGVYTLSGGVPDVLLSSFTFPISNYLTPTVEETLLDTPVELTEGTQYAIVLLYNPAFSYYIHGEGNTVKGEYLGGEWFFYSDFFDEWRSSLGEEGDMYFKCYEEIVVTPTPGHETTGISLYPLLSWIIE